MAFKKTSIGVSNPKQVELPKTRQPVYGEIRNGKYWNGSRWVSRQEFTKQGD